MKTKFFTLILALAASVGTMFADSVKIGDLYYNLNKTDKTAEVCYNDVGGCVISVVDNSLADWETLPKELVASAKCSKDAMFLGLNSVKVFADPKYINILVEPIMYELPDREWVPFHVFIDTDNSDATGGYGDLFTDANTDVMLEGALFAEGNPYNYNPAVFKWWGAVGGSGWDWVDGSYHDESDCWGAIVCEGQLQGCSSQYVNGKFEIQIDRTYIPATWNTSEFGIGFDILQNWEPVGVLPCAESTDENPHGKAAKMKVKIAIIDATGVISGNIAIPASVSYEGTTYSVTSIGSYSFSGCSGLTSVTIPNSVTSIGDLAFYGCKSLTSVTIPNGVTSIGSKAFYGCSGLTSVTIGNSVTSIESSIFEGCNNISSVIWDAKNCSTYNFGSQVESFVFGNDVEIIPDSLCQGMNKLTSVTIPNNVTSIGERTFDGCNNLETVSLGNSLESIGTKAFNGCERIIDIYCYAERVPTVQSSTFDGVSRKAYLWVPANRLRNYETHEIWGEFLVQPMAAEDVNTNTVAVVPDYNTAKIIWTVVENADSYSITITDKDGKTVCTLVFDSNGLLQSIAFGAPSRNNAPEQTQSTGFRFEVSGLEEGTAYDYTIVAKDVASQTLQAFNGSFKTLGGAEAVADINLNAASHMILLNGEVLILRDGKTYTIQGVEVK